MIYRLGQLICAAIFVILGWPRVTGREHVPRKGAAILAANHVSFLDPPFIGSSIWRPTWFMAKAELFDVPIFGSLIRGLHAFPVRRGAADRSALKRSLALLEQGEMLLIFPEGTRSETGELGPPELGVGMLTLRSGAPVIPIFISGTNQMLPRGARLPRPARLRMKIGPAIQFPPPAPGRADRELYARVAQEIMDAIARLQREP